MESQYLKVMLYVPEGMISIYQSTDNWEKFWDIEELGTYVIKYLVDGESFATDSIASGSKIILLDEPFKDGRKFSGWSAVPYIMPANDITIDGAFEYILTYKVNDELFAVDNIECGDTIIPKEVAVKEYQTFSGWIDLPETMPANEVVVYATYTRAFIETLAINDSDSGFSMEADTECGTIFYIRSFNDTIWQALYVPLELPYNDICDEFEVADINNVHQYDYDDDGMPEETVIEAFKVTNGILKPNYPYLIRAKEAGMKLIQLADAMVYATEENSIDCSSVREKFTFTGTYSRMSSSILTPNAGYYTLENGVWKPVVEEITLGAFRFYLKVDSRNGNTVMAPSIRMRIVGENEDGAEGGTTDIEPSTLNSQHSTEVYDLSGRRIIHAEKLERGIYIVNGERVLVK
jgi:hypothetical protein